MARSALMGKSSFLVAKVCVLIVKSAITTFILTDTYDMSSSESDSSLGRNKSIYSGETGGLS